LHSRPVYRRPIQPNRLQSSAWFRSRRPAITACFDAQTRGPPPAASPVVPSSRGFRERFEHLSFVSVRMFFGCCFLLVIPAQAGIHVDLDWKIKSQNGFTGFAVENLIGFRRNDG
jgi:hypothetical protein